MGEETTSVTHLLKAWSGGDQEALGDLTSKVYPELRRMAAKYTRKERSGDSLQATALVHEVFLINGDDTCSTNETRALIARHYREVPLRQPLEGYSSLWSHQKATRLLGYKPRYSWRHSDFESWARKRLESLAAGG